MFEVSTVDLSTINKMFELSTIDLSTIIIWDELLLKDMRDDDHVIVSNLL